MDRGLATQQRQRTQVTHAARAREARDQKLAAPQRPVVAEAGAVEDHAQNLAGAAVVDQTGGDMSVMVLDALARAAGLARPALRPARRSIVGVAIPRDGARPVADQHRHALDSLFEQ